MNNSEITSFPRTLTRPLGGPGGPRRWLVILPLVLLALIVGAMAAFSLRYSTRVYPGVEVMGTDLSGMTSPEAVAAIRAQMRSELQRSVSFALNGRTARVTAQQIGLSFDADATAKRALEVGRSGNYLDQWAGRVGALRAGERVAPVVSFDQRRATTVLQGLARQVDRPVRDAALVLGADGPAVTPSQVGLRLDVPATLRRMPSSLETLHAQQRPVATVIRATQPAVREDALRQTFTRLQTAWNRPLEATFRGRAWTLPVEDVRPMLSLRGERERAEPHLDREALTAWVTTLAEDIDRDARDARIRTRVGRVTVVPGRTAFAVDLPETVRRLEAATLSGPGTAEPAVTITPPDITTSELRPAAEQADAMVRRPLRLALEDGTWTLTRRELTEMLRWRGTGDNRTPYFPNARLAAWVEGAAAEVYRAPRDAEIEVTEAGARVVPERPGLRVARADTLESVRNSLTAPAGTVPVTTADIPAEVTATELRAAANEANRLIGKAVSVTYGDDTWTADPATLRSWLAWRGEGEDVEPYLDGSAIQSWVAAVAEEVYVPAQNAYVDLNGGAPLLIEEVEGVAVDQYAAVALLGQLTRGTARTDELPTTSTSPTVYSADLQPDYETIRAWMSGRLYLTMDEDHTWWLDPTDISEAVWWRTDQGADLAPWIDVGDMEAEIRSWVAEPEDTIIDYEATAQDAVDALYAGNRNVEITYRNVNAPAGDHVGNEAYWNGKFPAKWLDLNLRTQSMAAYEGGKQVRVSLITSGRPELATPTGVYSVISQTSPKMFISPWPKESKWYYEPAEANFALGFRTGGFYIHDAPWRSVYGPGTNGSGPTGAALTGSHGCVNVPYEMMAWVYRWADMGTPILIHY